MRTNEFGQPIGFALPEWSRRHFRRMFRCRGVIAGSSHSGPRGTRAISTKRMARIRRHPVDLLSRALRPLRRLRSVVPGRGSLARPAVLRDRRAASGRAAGSCTYMRIEPKHGVLEVGNIYFLRASRAARRDRNHVSHDRERFELGTAASNGSATAATCRRAPRPRVSASPMKVFRQAIVNKGRNRDTSWFAVIDSDWHAGLKAAYLRWLARELPRGRHAEEPSVGAHCSVRTREELAFAKKRRQLARRGAGPA